MSVAGKGQESKEKILKQVQDDISFSLPSFSFGAKLYFLHPPLFFRTQPLT
jgi:hypothetical protein